MRPPPRRSRRPPSRGHRGSLARRRAGHTALTDPKPAHDGHAAKEPKRAAEEHQRAAAVVVVGLEHRHRSRARGRRPHARRRPRRGGTRSSGRGAAHRARRRGLRGPPGGRRRDARDRARRRRCSSSTLIPRYADRRIRRHVRDERPAPNATRGGSSDTDMNALTTSDSPPGAVMRVTPVANRPSARRNSRSAVGGAGAAEACMATSAAVAVRGRSARGSRRRGWRRGDA